MTGHIRKLTDNVAVVLGDTNGAERLDNHDYQLLKGSPLISYLVEFCLEQPRYRELPVVFGSTGGPLSIEERLQESMLHKEKGTGEILVQWAVKGMMDNHTREHGSKDIETRVQPFVNHCEQGQTTWGSWIKKAQVDASQQKSLAQGSGAQGR